MTEISAKAVKFFWRAATSFVARSGGDARLSILIYHRVRANIDPLFPDEVDAIAFDRHLQWISSCFNVIPLAEAVRRLAVGSLPSRAACITFDDGYADNAEVALPILQRYGMSATFFVASGFLGGGWMFNDLVIESVRTAHGNILDLTDEGLGQFDISTLAARRAAINTLLAAVKYLPPDARDALVERISRHAPANRVRSPMMDARQVRELHSAGMEIGGHTVSHPILARLAPDAARREIGAGKEQLESIIDDRVTLFAYPNGKPNIDYKFEHVKMMRDLGIQAAVSTAHGVATRASDRYQLPRITPWGVTPMRFKFNLIRNMLPFLATA